MSILHLTLLFMTLAAEPVCSQFQNDKRLMEYMIETRYEVKNLTKDLRKTEEYLLTALEWRRKEMKQLEEGMLNITEKVNNLQETFGHKTVAFSAYNPFDKSLQKNEILILQSVLINEGKGYDTKSGIFTAPTNGLYHFTAHVCNTHALVIHYAIVKDGDWIARSQQFEQADENKHKYAGCSSVSALTRMEIGDQVWIMCTSGYSSSTFQVHDDGHRRNSFIGVLLHT
ncbi:heavy metal-binding protein HIP-like isoform X2 [Ruditapes philippinarum]|uniref:heavy metal-binding protein HIP-like isoform X2 n=1 Tax=Ruditapes philippinarum TaxID=129788 RepID=UPI00295BFA22|nr:heavy metal-binding protein HIP-like isoform X2 [Ruditapes philippinarum]